MEKHFRFTSLVSLLGTLALHAVIGILWAQSIYVPALSISLQKGTEIVVQLNSEQGRSPANSQPAISEAISEQALLSDPLVVDGSQDGKAVELEHSLPLPNDVFVLPPQELPYLPAAELDARPFPEAPVTIPFPEGTLNKNKSSAILILFIGADGKIDRIEVDKSDLPPLFEKTAIETFMQARMYPGLKNGKASRAQMKILVEFEGR